MATTARGPRRRLHSLATPGLLLGLSVAAGLPLRAAPPARFGRLSVEDGLSQSSVAHILQDRLGFLWFGTQEGLNRYDGYRFVVHRARERPGFLLDHNITALVEDGHGDLWIGTDRGLHRLDPTTGRVHRPVFEGMPPARIQAAVLDASGRVWVSGRDGGLWVVEEGRAAPLAAGELAACRVTALAPGRGASVLAACDGSLLELDRVAGTARVTELVADLGRVTALARDGAYGLWIGRSEGDLLRLDLSARHVESFPQAPREVLSLLPARDGALWIGARAGGLSRLDRVTGELVTHRHDPGDPTSLSKDDVASLFEDRAGLLWIGSWNGGLSVFDPYAQAFRTFQHKPWEPFSLPDDDVIAMSEAPDGRLWVGSRNGVCAVGDPRTGRFQKAPVDLAGRGRVTAIAHSGRTALLGTSRGLVTLDAATLREQRPSRSVRAQELDRRPISAAVRGARGELWLLSRGGVFRLAAGPGGELDAAPFAVPLRAPATALLVTPDGRLWVGSQAGELARDDGDGPRPVDADGLEDHPIGTMHEDADGRLWVGTQHGLARLERGARAAVWVREAQGLPSGAIAGILPGHDGQLWIATNRGITRLDPRSGAMAHFGTREGAKGTGYADGACARGASGLLYFAGQGVTAFDPREVRVNPTPPGIVFTGFEVEHKLMEPRWRHAGSPLLRGIEAEREITLPGGASVFAIEMSALHFGDPRSVRYAYRLEGFDKDWIETDAEHRLATYTRLPPGDYVLHVRARTKGGIWSAQEATLLIHVLPPWWRTRGAIVGWVVLTMLLAAAVAAELQRRTRVRVALAESETLRRASVTDALTGLSNRRFLTAYLEHEVPVSLRAYDVQGPEAEGADLVFLVIDVDHFKPINDRYSHGTGDRVLVAIAQALREQVRESDLAVRWGGDEFVIVSRSIDRQHAGATAERLRRAVEALDVGLSEGCTVSIGYAAFPFLPHAPRALKWEQALDLADRALLIAKRRGRNSCTGFEARSGLTVHAVIEMLSGGPEAELPAGLVALTPAPSLAIAQSASA